MALTRAQARDSRIIGSIGLFLDRNLKQAYDAEAASLAFPTALTIARGKPDDKSKVLKTPSILVDTIGGSDKERAYELGSNILWRHLPLVFYCFPALISGSPSQDAADLLKAYMRDTFGTYAIKLVDYTAVGAGPTNIIYCNDVADITNVGTPIDRKAASALAEEAHRFDMHVSIKYPVLETNAI